MDLAQEEMMETTDRKLQVVMKEWEHVEASIHKSTDAKFKIRQWSITLFSGVLALSVYQDRFSLIFIAIVTTLLFWLFDATRQTIQNVAVRRKHEIERALRDPSDDALDSFEAPLFGQMFERRKESSLHPNVLFRPARTLFFGSMILFSLVTLAVL